MPTPDRSRAADSRRAAPWLRGGATVAVAGAAAAYLLAYPLTIGNADESHLLNGARRVFDGEVLYAEIFEVITPLAFYLFSAVYWLAGPTLQAARVAMAAIEVVGALALFRLTARHAGLAEAAIGVLVFLVLCLPVWPYASAHWISTTLALLVAGVVLARPWRRTWAQPFVAGLLTGVAMCVQQQRGAFLALWLPLAYAVLAGAAPPGHRLRTAIRNTAWAIGGASLVTTLVLGHASWVASPGVLVEMLLEFAITKYGDFYRRTGWAAIQPLTDRLVAYSWHPLLRMAPLLPVLEVLRLGWRRPFGGPERARACLVLLAGCMALAVLYFPDAIHVSFVLPFLLIPGLCFLHDLRSSRLQFTSARVAGGLIVWGLSCALVARGAINLSRARSVPLVRWQSAFGMLETGTSMEELARAIGRHLVAEDDGRHLLYSYPNDAWLYLAVRAHNATRFDVMFPSVFPKPYADEVLAALRARRPGTVVLYSIIPVDEVRRTVEAHYELAEITGDYRVYVRQQGPP